MGALHSLVDLAALLLAFLTAPFTLLVIALTLPTYLLLIRHDKRQQSFYRTRHEQAVAEDRERKRRAALSRTLPARRRHGRRQRREI